MTTAALERIRRAVDDDDELSAVIEALHQEQVSTHQIADALGIADNEFGTFLSCRAFELFTPSALRAGDIIVSTQLAVSTLIRVQQPYRRLIGESTYSAEVTMPSSRLHQRIGAAVLESWLPCSVLRPEDAANKGRSLSTPRPARE